MSPNEYEEVLKTLQRKLDAANFEMTTLKHTTQEQQEALEIKDEQIKELREALEDIKNSIGDYSYAYHKAKDVLTKWSGK